MANIQNIPLSEQMRDSNPKINGNFSAINKQVEEQEERIDNLVGSTGESNSEILDARYDPIEGVTYPVLQYRLNAASQHIATKANQSDLTSTIATIATKAEKSEVYSMIASVSDGTPEAFKDLPAIQAAYPTGSNQAKLNIADGYVYNWNGSAWLQGWMYQTSGISNGSITPAKTNFFKISTNLYNHDTSTQNLTISSAGIETVNTDYVVSDFIAVSPNSDMSFNPVGNANGFLYFAEYDLNKVFITRRDCTATKTLGSSTRYIRVMGQKIYIKAATAQVNVGNVILPFEPYYVTVDEGFVGQIIGTKNLKDKVITEEKIGDNAVSPKIDISQSALRYKADKLIRPSFEIGALSTTNGTNLDTDVGCIRSVDYFSVSSKEIVNVYLRDKENYHWAYFQYSLDGTYIKNNAYTRNDLHLESGYKYKILVRKYPTDYTTNVTSQLASIAAQLYITYNEKSYYFSPEPISGWFEAPVVSSFGSGNTIDAIYNMYDDLAAEHPDDISKSFLGNDSTGLPIYSYQFKGSEVKQRSSYSSFYTRSLPKIIIATNIHGDEKASTYAIANLMKLIYTNWGSSPLLEYLRFNVQFVVVPIVNPYGFNNVTRRNANGVDLNRNFDYRWNASTDDYKGASAFSEVESQYIRTLITNNLDAMCFLDFHMNGSSGYDWTETYWSNINQIIPENQLFDPASRFIISKMTRRGQSTYNVPSDSGIIGRISYDNDTPLMAAWVAKQGIPSVLCECAMKLPSESESYTVTVHQMNLEYVTNMLLSIVNQFKTASL
ncbi:zinc carboxypeptidase [Paenibacillus cellulosilyticus]|uniref:Zinc carboxypeptidase n=1 Tax=Paenibacillus cellulosilyticus TaxID=375489 RepID=A0A2V2YP60_9BACL|nr:M14 family metallopeptidase [Paenibacillus cellulosilyticus]PWV97429.1 zinc carboxypeptidase [Paenibacillus cellulosilyticus]QKS48532.1 DUF2817 domain-containing protein [Paenibacillus cellulosilyticus]